MTADSGSASASDDSFSPVSLGNLLNQLGCTAVCHLPFLARSECLVMFQASSLLFISLSVNKSIPGICKVVLDGIKCFDKLLIIWFLIIC